MKWIPAISIFLALCVFAVIVGVDSLRKNEHAVKSELDSLKNVNAELEIRIQKKDSSISELKAIVEAQDLVIQSRELEVRQSKKINNQQRKELESIKFVMRSDSGQIAELKKLYKSWR